MADYRTVDIESVGPVFFEKSRRAKRILITVKNSNSVRVAVPVRASFEDALKFVHLKKSWIQRWQSKLMQREKIQEKFNYRLTNFKREEAKKSLGERLRFLADKYGFKFSKVTFREQKTRWGSCSAKNNISLNLRLILLPQEFIDYVILHELVHTKVRNHSDRFWAELDKYVANSRAISKELKNIHLDLI